jgi:anthranilate 1,2-dioxygenase large subunit
MLDQPSHHRLQSKPQAWTEQGVTRVPYWIFQGADVYAAEQRRLFRGPLWHFLCLAVELPGTGDFCTTFVGDTPVIVSRDADGELYAFENRCAHRGALIALDQRGNAKDFSCVYHAWTYDRQGNLTGVAFKDGIKGKGGMPPSFCMEEHGPRKLRVAEIAPPRPAPMTPCAPRMRRLPPSRPGRRWRRPRAAPCSTRRPT